MEICSALKPRHFRPCGVRVVLLHRCSLPFAGRIFDGGIPLSFLFLASVYKRSVSRLVEKIGVGYTSRCVGGDRSCNEAQASWAVLCPFHFR